MGEPTVRLVNVQLAIAVELPILWISMNGVQSILGISLVADALLLFNLEVMLML